MEKSGMGRSSPPRSPVVVGPGTSYIYLAPGQFSGFAITAGGVLQCWGKLYRNPYHATAVQIDPLIKYRQASLGSVSCGTTNLNALRCWGIFINPTQLLAETAPSTVFDPGREYNSVSVAASFACGITLNQDLKCFWSNLNGYTGVRNHQLYHSSAR